MHSLSTKIFPKTKRGGAKNGQINLYVLCTLFQLPDKGGALKTRLGL